MTFVALGMPSIRAAPSTNGRPDTSLLIDRFGRVARDLRISLTERCSLRCRYCMPAEGLPPVDPARLMTPVEVARLVSIATQELGISEIRFTGGEPLMRADLTEIISLSSAAAPGLPLSMTTNALGLRHRAAALAKAGLNRVNISLDTVDRSTFSEVTRRDRLDDTLAGIAAARRAGLHPIKINAVMMRTTLAEACDLVRWAAAQDVELRFIEQMPLDADEAWTRDEMIDAAELLDTLGQQFTLAYAGRTDDSAPAEFWRIDDGSFRIGVIASVTRSFCNTCDRTRITAEGSVRSCLFAHDETDLLSLVRQGASDREIADLWRAAMWGKKAGHQINSADFIRPARSMGAIGG